MATRSFKEIMETAEKPVPPPVGTYRVKCISADLARTQEHNKEMIKVCYQITAGPQEGKKIWNNFVLSPESPESLGFLATHLEAHGIDWSEYEEFGDIASALLGCEVQVTITHRDWQGQPRANVQSYNKIKGGKPAAPEGQKKSGERAPPPPPPVPS